MQLAHAVPIDALPAPGQFAFKDISADDFGRTMEWEGPVSDAVDQTAEINAGQESLTNGPWCPARIVRAIINSEVCGPERINLTSLATEVALRTYAGVPGNERLASLRKGLALAGLLHTKTSQMKDLTTSLASTAELPVDSSTRIADRLPGSPLFIVALCHGGLVAALQTALYSSHGYGHDVAVYPIRNSLKKHGDRNLYLPDSDEIRHIIALAEGRQVILHDEDAANGTTMQKAIIAMKGILWRTCPDIFGIVNLDSRSPQQVQDQGEWWDK